MGKAGLQFATTLPCSDCDTMDSTFPSLSQWESPSKMPLFRVPSNSFLHGILGNCYPQQIMHGEDFVGGEVEVAGDMTFGEDVDGLGAVGGGPDSAGEVVFGREVREWRELTKRAIGDARGRWFGGAEVGLAAVAFGAVTLAAEDLKVLESAGATLGMRNDVVDIQRSIFAGDAA